MHKQRSGDPSGRTGTCESCACPECHGQSLAESGPLGGESALVEVHARYGLAAQSALNGETHEIPCVISLPPCSPLTGQPVEVGRSNVSHIAHPRHPCDPRGVPAGHVRLETMEDAQRGSLRVFEQDAVSAAVGLVEDGGRGSDPGCEFGDGSG